MFSVPDACEGGLLKRPTRTLHWLLQLAPISRQAFNTNCSTPRSSEFLGGGINYAGILVTLAGRRPRAD